MISLIYPLLSALVFGLFYLLAQPLVQIWVSQQRATILQTYYQETQDQEPQSLPIPATAAAQLTQPERYLTDQIASALVVPTLDPTQEENYIVEPVGGGFFKLLNVPDEPMSTREELNSAVNQFRVTHGLGGLEIDPHLCGFADQRASEIDQDFTHVKFSEHIDNGIAKDWGFSNFGENIWQGAFQGVHIVEYGWAKSPGHFAALVGDWTKGCGGIFATNAVFIFAR